MNNTDHSYRTCHTMTEYDILERAINLAVSAHEGQVDRGGVPYILHALHVMMKGRTVEEMTVGVLHDVDEDTSAWGGNMSQCFPPRVVEAVDALTRRGDETYEEYIARVARNPLARVVKVYDLEHNLDLSRLPKPLTDRDHIRAEKHRLAQNTLLISMALDEFRQKNEGDR